ncbi:DUF3253 domain-containing protein [Kordiimonas marina]|uniref:DUF3253 domain-containing protein n=1 Tax=Kordiimonas marina TaxID=2872312 RepID=UPI001FF3F451|nr:DUF3253 domain-containing protein [Kordiimonas marina]MCJ9428216.1 DUF3253 domain-containing protein [Kordiimonas marina]
MAVGDDAIRSEILKQITGDKSVAPREVAEALAEEGSDWRKLLPRVRLAATKLHGEGLLVFIRKRKVVGPEGLKGVYRLARPGLMDDSE